MRYRRWKRILALYLFLNVLSGCLSNENNNTSPVINNSPVAVAGEDQSVTIKSDVWLDGSGSWDPDDDALSYQWVLQQIPESSVSQIVNPDSVQPSLVPDLSGTYTVELVVNDGKADSESATVVIVATDPVPAPDKTIPQNTAPVADTGKKLVTVLGNSIVLNGSSSSDADGDTLTFHWQITQSPTNSSPWLDDPRSEKPTLDVDQLGNYVVTLTVNDGETDSAGSEVTVVFKELLPLPAVTTDQIIKGNDDLLYVLSPEQSKILRWSRQSKAFLEPIETAAPVSQFAFSDINQYLYLTYADGVITTIDTNSNGSEESLIQLSSTPNELLAAGEFLFIATTSNYDYSYLSYSLDGELVDSVATSKTSSVYVWSETGNRIFHFADNLLPNDLYSLNFDSASGLFGKDIDSPQHGDYNIAAPIRVSRDDSKILLGSGDIYSGDNMEVMGSLPHSVIDALWIEIGLLTLKSNDSGKTVLERWDDRFRTIDSNTFSGMPVRIFEQNNGYLIVTWEDGRLFFHDYTLSNDSDGDGVPNENDAFPIDAAATIDSDGDQYPDFWNNGKSEIDSTTSLVLDAFPENFECYLPEHGLADLPDVCNIAQALPDFLHFGAFLGSYGIVYMINYNKNMIFRWSLELNRYLSTIKIGFTSPVLKNRWPYIYEYDSSEHSLYLGYSSGEITRINLNVDFVEVPFVKVDSIPRTMAMFGSRLLLVAGTTLFTYDLNGNQLSTSMAYSRPGLPVWNQHNNRMFYLSGYSPTDVNYFQLDPQTGSVLSGGDSPYHGDYRFTVPLRLSTNGRNLLVGSGYVLDSDSLEVVNALPVAIRDAQWIESGLISIRDNGAESSVLEQWDQELRLFNQQQFPGKPQYVLATATGAAVITLADRKPLVHNYTSSMDADRDGVENTADAFWLDPSASVDTDGDGFPDSWNSGYNELDSNSGLTLDAFPFDSACQLPEHALPDDISTCDIASAIPEYVPDAIVMDVNETVYLLSREHNRIFRWSVPKKRDLNPLYASRLSPGLADDKALYLTYSAELHRLYIGYDSGLITHIDLQQSLQEQAFATVPDPWFNNLLSAGKYLFVASNNFSRENQYLYDPFGNITSRNTQHSGAGAAAWDPVQSRIYFIEDRTWSSSSIYWLKFDPLTGIFNARGVSPYPANSETIAPLIITDSGNTLMDGFGTYYDTTTFGVLESHPGRVTDAQWTDAGLRSIRSYNLGTLLESWNASRDLTDMAYYEGTPLKIMATSGADTVVTLSGGKPTFWQYTHGTDADGDNVPTVEDKFPFDTAASIDSDNDGYPDQWNDGFSQADSTTGLSLDAFPQDFACQTVEHGVNGLCDFQNILPATPSEAMCSHDTVVTSTPAGHIDSQGLADMIPLCNGWIAIADITRMSIRLYNPLIDRQGAEFFLWSKPYDMELDESNKYLYISAMDGRRILRLDLISGLVSSFKLSLRASSMSLWKDGNILFTENTGHFRNLYYLNLDSGDVLGGWYLSASMFVYNPITDEIIAGTQELSPSTLIRYSFTPDTGLTQIQKFGNAGTNAQDLTISPDGNHIAYVNVASYPGGVFKVNDPEVTDLNLNQGEWMVREWPTAANFSSDSADIAIVDSTAMNVFDVSSHQQLQTFTFNSCWSGRFHSTAFSRGGKYVFALEKCGIAGTPKRLHWFTR